MKIFHLTKTLFGGSGQYALRLSNALRAQGVESSVLVAEGPVSDGVDLLKRVDSPVRRFAARAIRSLSRRISTEAFQSIRSCELYETPLPITAGDIVHLHGMTAWIGVAGLRRLIPQGVRVFWTAHDMWMLSGGCVVYTGSEGFQRNCESCPILRHPWKRVAMQELRTKEAFIDEYEIQPIANSGWMAKRIQQSRFFRDVESVPVIPPIVDNAYLVEDIPDLRRELQIAANRRVISLGARSLDDRFKGIPAFLQHLSKRTELANNLTVLLFGPGLINVPANLDVRLLGSITNPAELAKVYRTSDVYVSPSAMESFGMTLVEAQAVGTPVAAFDVGGTQDAVHPAARATLESVSEPERLISRLASLITRPPTDRHAGNPLRTWTRMHFSAEQVAREQVAVYAKAR